MKAKTLIVLLLAGLVSLAASAAQPPVPEGPLVVSENWPECTSLQTWMRDIIRLESLDNASETAQAKAFFRWLRLFSRMATGGMIQAHEGTYGREAYVLDAHKNAFVYGWGYCDTHSRIGEAAWSEFKQDRKAAERVVVQHEDGGYHTMFRLRLDGRYAAFDARYGYYLIDKDTPDARILAWPEVGDDRRILQNREYRNRSTPFFEYFGREWDRALLLQPVFYETEEDWAKAGQPVECVFGNGQYQMGTRFHDMSFRLPRGTTIERHWDNSARKFYVPAGFESKGEEPFRPSGRFYRVTETMFGGNWVKHDPNYKLCAPYVTVVPPDEGYNREVSGGKTIGQAWGRMVYEAPLGDAGFLEEAPVTGDLVWKPRAPHLRPKAKTVAGQAIFDFYSPYVLVDGVLSGDWVAGEQDQPRVELRVLEPKPRSESEPDVWTPWQTITTVGESFRAELGRPRFNGRSVSIHGAYRFQIRFSFASNPERTGEVGLKFLRLETWFENGLMSIPRLVAGRNVIRFKLKDASALKAPVRVTYDFETAEGVRRHERVLLPKDFRANMATYSFDAPGLRRCNRLRISYE
jgi:hypothetical protein